jgi:hypothetical protein
LGKKSVISSTSTFFTIILLPPWIYLPYLLSYSDSAALRSVLKPLITFTTNIFFASLSAKVHLLNQSLIKIAQISNPYTRVNKTTNDSASK